MAVERREAITSLIFDATRAEQGASQFERAAQRVTAANSNAAASTERVAVGSAGFDRALNNTINRLDPYSKALQQLTRDHDTLQRGVEKGKLSVDGAASLFDVAKDKALGMAERMAGAGAAAELSAIQYSRLATHAKSAASEIAEGNFVGAATSLGGIAAHLSEVSLGFAAAGVGAVAFVGAVSLGIIHAEEMDSEIRKLDVALGAMGRSAGVSAVDLRGLAGDLEKLGVNREAALEGIAEIVRTGEFTGEQITQTATLAADAAARYGTSYQSAQQKIIAISEHGFTAIKSVDEQWHFLTASQLDNIRTMAEHGQSVEATSLALDLLRGKAQGAARDAMTPLAKSAADLSESWRHLLDAFAQSAPLQAVVTALAALVGSLAWIIAHGPDAGKAIGFVVGAIPNVGPALQVGGFAPQPVELGRSGDIPLPPASTFPEGGPRTSDGAAERTESAAAIERQRKALIPLNTELLHEQQISSASIGLREQVRARIEAEAFARDNHIEGALREEVIRIKVAEAVLKQTTAMRDQTEALRLNIAETERATAAYGVSLAAGLAADAQREAIEANRLNPQVDIGERTRLLLRQRATTGAEGAARDLTTTGLDVAALGTVAAAGSSPAAVRAAQQAAEAEKQFRQPLAAAQASLAATAPGSDAAAQAQAVLDGLRQQQAALQDLLGLRERENLQIKSNDEVRQLQQAVAEKGLEASLIGRSVDVRERELAQLKLRNQLVNEGFEGQQLDAELAKRQALTDELAKYNAAIERNHASEKAFDMVVKQAGNDIATDLTGLVDGSLKLSNLLSTLEKQFLKLGNEVFITKPLQTFIDKDIGSSGLKDLFGGSGGPSGGGLFSSLASLFGFGPSQQYAQPIGPGLPGSPSGGDLLSTAAKDLTKSATDLSGVPNVFQRLFGQQITSQIYITAASVTVAGGDSGSGAGGIGSLFGSLLGGGGAAGGSSGAFGGAAAGASTSYGSTFLEAGSSAAAFAAKGLAFNRGNIIPFAEGDIFDTPTLFPMAGGRTGMLGEAGPEAILPLTKGPDGRLGVDAKGGGDTYGGHTIELHQHFHGQTDAATVDRARRTGTQGAIDALRGAMAQQARLG